MTAKEFEETLRGLLDRKPFQPFIVEYNDGERIEVDVPDVAFSGGAAGFLGKDFLHSFDYKNVKRFIASPVEKSA
jgi:hypothetical protein